MSESQIRILKASLALFAENGYASTSMSDIANAVGIRKATLYSHFKNKEALFEALFDQVLENHRLATSYLFRSLKEHSPLVQLEHYFVEYIEYCQNNMEVDFWIRFYYFPPKPLADSILRKTQHSEETGRKELLETVERGIESGEIRDLPADDIMFAYYQLLIGFLMSLNDYKGSDPKPDMHRCLNLFLSGIRT